MKRAQPGWTKPQAGVTATRPMIGPTHAPEIEMWPRIASMTTQVTSPAAAAACEFISARAARPLQSSFTEAVLSPFGFTWLHWLIHHWILTIPPTTTMCPESWTGDCVLTYFSDYSHVACREWSTLRSQTHPTEYAPLYHRQSPVFRDAWASHCYPTPNEPSDHSRPSSR